MIKVNNYEIPVTVFPDGTSQVWKIPEEVFEGNRYCIEFLFENEAEVFQLMQLTTLLKHGQVPRPVTLHMPYLPYARQDKEVSNESTFALRTFAKLINSMNFTKVKTVDAHSDVAAELFDNFENEEPDEYINQARLQLTCFETGCEDNLLVAAPDAGAANRYSKHSISIVGHKVRNQSTGYIEKYDVEGDPKGKDVLIIDDICDGGMTFKLFTKELLTRGANSVNLYVTHGIFSKGIETLKESGISRIFTKEGEIK